MHLSPPLRTLSRPQPPSFRRRVALTLTTGCLPPSKGQPVKEFVSCAARTGRSATALLDTASLPASILEAKPRREAPPTQREYELQESSFSTFACYLRSQREARAMKVTSLSQVSGISVERLAALESGTGTPNRRELRLLARVFRIPPEKMIVMAGQSRLILD